MTAAWLLSGSRDLLPSGWREWQVVQPAGDGKAPQLWKCDTYSGSCRIAQGSEGSYMRLLTGVRLLTGKSSWGKLSIHEYGTPALWAAVHWIPIIRQVSKLMVTEKRKERKKL